MQRIALIGLRLALVSILACFLLPVLSFADKFSYPVGNEQHEIVALGAELGRGAAGTVYSDASDDRMAVKIIIKSKAKDFMSEAFPKFLQLPEYRQAEHLLQYSMPVEGIFTDANGNQEAAVMMRMPKIIPLSKVRHMFSLEDLASLKPAERRQRIRMACHLAYQIFLSDAEARETGHLLFDLKPDNYGLVARTEADINLQTVGKAFDLEFIEKFDDVNRTVLKGTPAYIAPEFLIPGSDVRFADRFSAGQTLLSTFFGNYPSFWFRRFTSLNGGDRNVALRLLLQERNYHVYFAATKDLLDGELGGFKRLPGVKADEVEALARLFKATMASINYHPDARADALSGPDFGMANLSLSDRTRVDYFLEFGRSVLSHCQVILKNTVRRMLFPMPAVYPKPTFLTPSAS